MDRADLDLIDASGALDAAATWWLRDRAVEALRVLGVGGEVRVRVADDAEMSASHERYAGMRGPTDVLTFDLGGGVSAGAGGGRVLDADVLVCVDEARRQAEARGHGVERELLLYIVHGVLHCLGHDDHDADRAAAMHAREDEVLEAIGVGATYARSGAGGAATDDGAATGAAKAGRGDGGAGRC
jgi:probable rRNA maturation factor